MKIGMTISIDVTKIDKTRLFKGKKGTYMDLTTFIDTDTADQYGNHGFISQSQTKEERESGAERTAILGNSKVFYKDGSQAQQSQSAQQAQPQDPAGEFADFDDDIPF
jgi:single-stranded DNA-binding protein